MKHLSLLVSGILLASVWSLIAQQHGELVKPISAAEAKKFVGTNAVVVGKVAEVYRTEKLVRINLEEKYPKQLFTAVVFASNYKTFPDLDSLTGKTIELSGKIVEFQGRPEMVLTSKGQLRVLEADKPPKPSR